MTLYIGRICSFFLWFASLFAAAHEVIGATSWADKLKRRVPQHSNSHQQQHREDEDAASVYYPFTVQRDTPNLCSMWKCRDIPRMNVTNEVNSKYSRDRRPIVLSVDGDSPVRTWKALNWNFWYWASKSWPVLNNVLAFDKADDMANNVFLIKEEDSSRDAWEDVSDSELRSFPTYNIQHELFLWDFLYDVGVGDEKPISEKSKIKQSPEQASSEKEGKLVEKEFCRFYSQDFQEMEEAMKIESDTNWKKLVIREELGFPDEDENFLVPPLFNMLYPGCSLQFRYNEYHTAKVQVFGKSRYYLVSPSNLAELYLFPSTTVSPHQLQINLYHLFRRAHDQLDWLDSALAQSLLGRNDLLEMVELSAGETLFIPPGYAVLTEAKSLSITIDVLSPSREQVLFMEALMTPLPMTRYADQNNNKSPLPLSNDEKVIFTQVYLAHLISRIDGITSIGRYTRKLYKSRYSLQFPLDSLSMQTLASSFDCYKNQPKLHDKIVKSMHPEQVEKIANFVAKKFNDQILLMSGIKWVLLGNYIEHVVRDLWETKPLEWVPLYLTSCLDIDSKIKVIEEVEGPPVMKLNPIY